MNRQEFEDTARRYREEMFRLYAGRQMNPPPKPVQMPAPVPAPPPRRDLPPTDFRQMPAAVPEPPAMPQDPPQPELPPALQDVPDSAPQDDPQENMIKPETDGGIRVHVFTARGAVPVAGATVIITREAGGETVLISVQQSDDCGDCPEVRVPAPPSTADEQFPAYYTYDIAVQADGYYRERSADVPVFEGVVSVQSFDLIPLPAGHDDPYASGLTYYNSMPQP